MTTILQSFLLVFISEMGDKTQLLALVLAAQFRKPMPIMGGILVATLLNHTFASYFGSYITQYIPADILKVILGLSFIGFGFWILIPDKDQEIKKAFRWGPFVTTTILFFLAEMGDKTQLATVALGAKFSAPLAVTLGTTLGMLGADGLAVTFGYKFNNKIPMKLINRVASAVFILFGAAVFLGF